MLVVTCGQVCEKVCECEPSRVSRTMFMLKGIGYHVTHKVHTSLVGIDYCFGKELGFAFEHVEGLNGKCMLWHCDMVIEGNELATKLA